MAASKNTKKAWKASKTKKTKRAKSTPQQEGAMVNLESCCVQCGQPLFKPGQPPPKVRFETNGVGENIAWCVCPACRKVSPVKLSAMTYDY